MKHILFIVLCAIASPMLLAHPLVLEDKAATALNKVILYPDSSFFEHSNTFYPEGTLFDVIGESHYEHEDNLQNQKFKWYQVKAHDGKQGWVYGDGLALILAPKRIPNKLLPFHKKKYRFNNGFEQSMIWMAAMEGRDNLHQEDYLNPLYKEFYIVITNAQHRSVHIQYAGFSTRGEFELSDLYIKDLTDDGIEEFVLQQTALNTGNPLEERSISVYNFQAGTLVKILEENMTLTKAFHQASPALYKHIELGEQYVRVAFIDYMNCEKYQQSYAHQATATSHEYCMEYVTYTYYWDEKIKKYELLYGESRIAPKAKLNTQQGFLLARPFANAQPLVAISSSTPLTVIKDCQTITKQGRQQQKEHYFYVRLASGQMGYLPASKLYFDKSEHAPILERFYQNPALAVKSATVLPPFLTFSKTLRQP